MTPEELSVRLWRFAARVGQIVDALPDTRLGRHVADQLVRPGTSAPTHYDEGCDADNRADFICGLGLALRDQRRTLGWLRFIRVAGLLPDAGRGDDIDECQKLCRVLERSIAAVRGHDAGGIPPAPMTMHDDVADSIPVPAFRFPPFTPDAAMPGPVKDVEPAFRQTD